MSEDKDPGYSIWWDVLWCVCAIGIPVGVVIFWALWVLL